MQAFDIDLPWIVYRYLTTDRMTRFTGRSHIEMRCAICGHSELRKIRIPRRGAVPEPVGGQHLVRVEFKLCHLHSERPDPVLWAQPFLAGAAQLSRLPTPKRLEEIEVGLHEIAAAAAGGEQ